VGRSAFDQHIWIIGLLLALLSLLYTGIIVQNSRREAVAHASADMRGLGIVLADQTSRYVQTIDLVLTQTQSYIQDLGIRTPDEFRHLVEGGDMNRLLVARMMNPPQGHGIDLFDAEGALINTSQPSPAPLNIADDEYFQRLRDYRHSGLVVSEVSTRYGTSGKAFFIGRRISGPDGSFLGAILTMVDIDGVYDFYNAIDNQRRLTVTLRRSDSSVLVRYPAAGGIDQAEPLNMSWFELVTHGGGVYHAPDDPTAVHAIMSVNPAPRYPLVLDVAAPEENILKPWHDQAVFIMMAGGAFSVVLLAIFALLGRQMRRQKEQNAALSRSEATLRENEARFRDFSELASDWFWEQDAELRFIALTLDETQRAQNRARDKESPIGKLRWELNDTSHDPGGWENHRRTLLAHQPFRDFSFDQIDEYGQVRHVSISGVPVHDQNGVFTGYRGIGRDITAQIEAEQDLRQAKEKAEHAGALLQDAIDSVAEGLVICDADDRQVVCNEGYRRLYRYRTSIPWVLGNTRSDVLRQGLANGAYPEAISHDQAWRDAWLQRKLEVPSSIEQPLADGRWLLVTKRRMRDGGIAILLIDITTLKQAQSALRDSEIRLERAQEIGKIGSWELDIATGELTWSKQLYRILGLPFDFKPNRENIGSGIHAADVQPRSDWFAALSAGRKRDPIEIRVTLPNGEERVILSEGRPVVDADGVIRHIAGTTQDITERRQIERALAQSQKMDAIGQLTGGMAHDFNNMLGIVIGNLDLLKRAVGANALASELCAEARDGAIRCADLIRRLLAFARRQSLRPEQTDVNTLTRDVSRLLGRTLGEHITLALDLDATLWPVKVDAAQLEAALVNLATNARDAMPKGGQLIIATRNTTLDASYTAQYPDVNAGDYALIEVCDTGTGIQPEIVGRIFDPFFTTKACGQGTGLGLSMAFGFVKQSGGHLSVYSEPGLGTTFRIYLPRSDDGATTKADTPGADEVVGGDETILVVEDNAHLRRTAERQLTELGYKVREADSALPALAILSGGKAVDLLFTDIVMPGTMDGLDLAYQAMRLRPGLRVLLTSGFPGGHGADQRMANSPFRLLGKPYSLRDLAQAVRMVLDKAGNGPGHRGIEEIGGDDACSGI
jgi:signal transduction histidine kinase/CheY-like chemotaxis protein